MRLYHALRSYVRTRLTAVKIAESYPRNSLINCACFSLLGTIRLLKSFGGLKMNIKSQPYSTSYFTGYTYDVNPERNSPGGKSFSPVAGSMTGPMSKQARTLAMASHMVASAKYLPGQTLYMTRCYSVTIHRLKARLVHTFCRNHRRCW